MQSNLEMKVYKYSYCAVQHAVNYLRLILMQHRETEMTVKLASVLNMTRAQLEMELKKQ